MAASGRQQIDVLDECDPVTFAQVPGGCVGDGNVTLDELLEEVNPQDFGHNAWRFTREATHITKDEVLKVKNLGGEVHSFTQVENFGPGIVPLLNGVFPPGAKPAVPAENPDPTFLPPGGTRIVGPLASGGHMFQCLIHPWMHSTVEVRNS